MLLLKDETLLEKKYCLVWWNIEKYHNNILYSGCTCRVSHGINLTYFRSNHQTRSINLIPRSFTSPRKYKNQKCEWW